MTSIDIVIISLIIVISTQLLYDYVRENDLISLVRKTFTEKFAEIDMDDSDRDVLTMYKLWLKKNEGILSGIHASNFTILNDRNPIPKEDHNIVHRDPVPIRSDLDGSIDFLEEQNKILTKNFKKHANKIGLISANEEKMNFYVSTSAVDREIVVIDPKSVLLKKKKLPVPKKLKK